jgi:signal transduction histidine kinase/ActR/RegA family two-component response regulator
MNALRIRILLPLMLFGWLPAIGAARFMGQPLDWFFSSQGFILLAGVFVAAYMISGWALKPVVAVMNATTSVMRGIPPVKEVTQWLPKDFWKLRCDINMLFAKHRQSLNAAETHASQTAQRLLNAERLLREAFTALQGIFAASDEGVAVVDANGTIIASNAKLDAFLGKPLEEIGSRDVKQLMQAVAERFKNSDKILEWVSGTVTDPKLQTELEAETNESQVRAFSLRTAPMQTDTGEVIGRLWMIRDCSEVRVLQKQLRESQKLGTIGQLAGGIAHDFNNMLTAIRGNITLAELSPSAGNPDMKDRLQSANHATQRAADLVKQLLGYSRRGSGNHLRKVTNLKKLLADVQSLLKPSVDPRVTIRVRAGMDASFALADSIQLEQVMLNLCLNARDSLPSDSTGIIEIGIENVMHRTPGDEGSTSEFVMIAVRDNGSGIPDDMRHRIFEPFFTTKESGRGTGLGLSMAQDIVREHGGWIEFDSVACQGTEFRVFLPRSSDPENIEDEIQAPDLRNGSSPIGIRGTILVVDDEAPVRSIAVNMLNFLGYRVLEAGDGQQALDIVMRSGEKIDALMLDIYMPKLSGRDTFKQLRALGNDIPIVICSGFVIDPDEFTLLSEGRCPPVDIMLKPYSLDGLSKSIAKAVKSALSPDAFARQMAPVLAA